MDITTNIRSHTNRDEATDLQVENDIYTKIPDIAKNSPSLLQEIMQIFGSTDAKVVSLFSSSVLCGTLFPNVKINYNNQDNYLALMLTIVAPPASEKGALSQVKKIGRGIESKLRDEYNQALKKYKRELKAYKQSVVSGIALNEPERPILKMVQIPGNISSAKMVQQLADNGPNLMGIIAETEIDTLGISSKSTYGEMLTTLIRNAFHHEKISSLRKTNSEFLEVPIPKLAFILSGTFSQMKNFIPSNEDGTYSRLMILELEGCIDWKDVTPRKDYVSIDERLNKISEKCLQVFNDWSEIEAEVRLEDHQWRSVNKLGEDNLEIAISVGEHATSIAKRHPLMLVRLAGILTMLRNHEQTGTSIFTCNDIDFDIAHSMISHSLKQSMSLFQRLPGEKQPNIPYPSQLLNSLPLNFELKDMRDHSQELGYKQTDRTLQRWLNDYINDGSVTKIKKGNFTKSNIQQSSVLS